MSGDTENMAPYSVNTQQPYLGSDATKAFFVRNRGPFFSFAVNTSPFVLITSTISSSFCVHAFSLVSIRILVFVVAIGDYTANGVPIRFLTVFGGYLYSVAYRCVAVKIQQDEQDGLGGSSGGFLGV